jgi:Protein of unknown function (DUF2778)
MLDPQGNLLAAGYSGAVGYKNNPDNEDLKERGPIPCGSYAIHPPVDTVTHGPFVMWLTPDPANEMYGRSAFGIHGDSVTQPGTASEGCIILPRYARDRIAESGDSLLKVISRFVNQ